MSLFNSLDQVEVVAKPQIYSPIHSTVPSSGDSGHRVGGMEVPVLPRKQDGIKYKHPEIVCMVPPEFHVLAPDRYPPTDCYTRLQTLLYPVQFPPRWRNGMA